MVKFARHGLASPDTFGRMTPARCRTLDAELTAQLDDEWEGYVRLAMIARGGR
jgi:hypothetical protein